MVEPELKPIDYKLPVASAQVKSAILFAGVQAGEETSVEEPVRTRDHGELALRAFGAEVTRSRNRVTIKGGQKQLSFHCYTSSASCTGDIAGGPWSAAKPFETKGSGFSGVRVRLYFTSTPAAP